MRSNPLYRSYGGSSEPSVQINKDATFSYYGKTYSNGESATVGPWHIISGVHPEPSDKILNWISRLGNEGGDFYSNAGGAGLGESGPFFRANINKIINVEGYFGGIHNGLSRSANGKPDMINMMVDLMALFDMSRPFRINNSTAEAAYNYSWLRTSFTGTELLYNPEGKGVGTGATTETRFIDNLSKQQLDSVKSRNAADSIRYNMDAKSRGDSLLNQMLKRS